MNVFCTLFDSNFLSRGIALHESLCRYCNDFKLYIFPFDDKCHEILSRLSLANVELISLDDFQDQQLLNVKPARSAGEYCWTCTPSAILYVLEKHNAHICTYLDADTYFYSSPNVLLDELNDSSVIITSHRYTPEYDRSEKSGKYCVQFATFKRDQKGLEILNWWRNACISWCYARYENGKFGDQKYLDDWPERFDGVHVLEHRGGGVAPWNIQQYDIEDRSGKLYGIERSTGNEFEIVFYHFHNVRFYHAGYIELGNYRLAEKVQTIFYRSYLDCLNSIKKKIERIDISFDPHGTQERKMTLRDRCGILKRKLKGRYNYYNLEKFMRG